MPVAPGGNVRFRLNGPLQGSSEGPASCSGRSPRWPSGWGGSIPRPARSRGRPWARACSRAPRSRPGPRRSRGARSCGSDRTARASRCPAVAVPAVPTCRLRALAPDRRDGLWAIAGSLRVGQRGASSAQRRHRGARARDHSRPRPGGDRGRRWVAWVADHAGSRSCASGERRSPARAVVDRPSGAAEEISGDLLT